MKKTANPVWLFTIILVVLTAFPVALSLYARERHPEIYAAARALENARQHLQHGAHDFGGHRARALQLTAEALQECRAAIQYDRR
ncbi:MAG: hypothetical protein ACRD1N_06825 [Terriglobia bacterium]